MAVIYTELGNDTSADDALKEGLLSDADNLGVRTAQAYIALKRNKTATLARFSTDLAREQGQRTEVNYFLSALTNRLNQFVESRRFFERAVLAEPTNYDMYIEEGNESINVGLSRGMEKKDVDAQFENARLMFETALIARPESYEALTGLAIVDMLQKKPADAVKHAEAAVAAGKSYGGAYYTLAAAYEAARMADRSSATADYDAMAQKANTTAGKLDRLNLEGRSVPDVYNAWKYSSSGGRSPVMAPPK
jgi:Tfp pilus assembly protein PilF